MPHPTYADGHCHLADPRIVGEASRLIRESEARGIGLFVQGGVDPEDWDRQLELRREHPGKILTSFGLHPWWVASHSRDEFDHAFALLSGRICEADAFGEIGLDRGQKLSDSSYPVQEYAYRAQLGLAQTAGKPLILHVVHAHESALRGLKETAAAESSGIVHSFSGGKEIAREYLDLGLHLSISGVITRKGFETLKRTVSYIPLDRLILETDSPDQKPADWDGEWNEPISLFETAEAIGEIRGCQPEALLEASAANLKKLFGIRS